jgi:signal transduction histidine kinase
MTGRSTPLAGGRIDLAVDVGFVALMVVCGARYFTRHPFEGDGVIALILAIGATASYAVAVIGGGIGHDERWRRGGVLLATALWVGLAVLAPSFGWCAFALFFAVHRVLQGTRALVLSTIIVLAVSAGLFLMSRGDDLGLVLGPLLGGIVLSAAYGALDRALAAQRSLNDELLAARDQLAASEREAGALSERNRVAGELHDTVVQRTASVLLLLESSRHGSPDVIEAREGLRDALTQTRRVLHGLAAPADDREPLAATLARLVDDARSADAAGAEFAVVGVPRDVSDTTAHALQRIVQEALVNVRKHAAAQHARVTLTFFPEAIGVDIADDGAGITRTTGSADGVGLRAMRWRAESLGGSFTVGPLGESGTVVSAVIPDAAVVEESS